MSLFINKKERFNQKKHFCVSNCGKKSGDERSRTVDPLLAKQVL